MTSFDDDSEAFQTCGKRYVCPSYVHMRAWFFPTKENHLSLVVVEFEVIGSHPLLDVITAALYRGPFFSSKGFMIWFRFKIDHSIV